MKSHLFSPSTNAPFFTHLLIMSYVFLFMGCDVQNLPPPLPPLEPPPVSEDAESYKSIDKKSVIVFVDLTTQRETRTHVTDISKNLEQIIINIPPSSNVSIYPIDRSFAVPPIAEFTTPPKPRNTTQKKQARAKITLQVDHVKETIITLFNDVYLPARNQPTSCIIGSLHRAYSIFSRISKTKNSQMEVIILSDMVEECENSSFGMVSMTKKLNTFPLFIKQYQPDFNLESVEYFFVLSTQEYLTESHAVPFDLLTRYWREIFIQVGYSENQVAQLAFNTRLPEQYQNPNGIWN